MSIHWQETDVVLFRIPQDSAGPLETAAAERGETVQALVGGLVRHFLAAEMPRAPDPVAMLATLRGQAGWLRERGLAGLWVPGAPPPAETVTLQVEFAAGTRLSLVGLASLRAALAEMLGTEVDLVDRAALPAAARAGREAEALRAL